MSNNYERVGVSKIQLLVNQELNWIFREQPTDDYGIDAQIEIFDGKYATGKLIAVQIKSGPSYFQEANGNHIIYRGDEKHLVYWTKHSLPVIIILYNPETEECIWEHISKDKIQKTGETGWKVLVPRTNKFDKTAKNRLNKIADNLTEYERRLNSLVLSKPLMREIQDGNDVILESDEWINKCSGVGSVTLKIIDASTMKEKVALDWPVVFFPMQNYKQVFGKLFPWADIAIDEDFYEPYDEDRFLLEECPYDSETGEYVFLDEFFDEWKAEQDEIRPYENSSGEVDHYRLKLQLNDLGKTFLKLDFYLENTSFYIFSKDDFE